MNRHYANLPSLDAGISYTQVSAGGLHTVLLRSDRYAVACGFNASEQTNISQLEPGKKYVGDLDFTLILQAKVCSEDDVVSLLCSTVSGDEMIGLNVRC